jgi:hypothetical protein
MIAKILEKAGKKSPAVGSGMGQNIRKMGSPVFNVTSGGSTVEWTDKLSEASGAYEAASTYPKAMWEIAGDKIRLVKKQDWNS